jgi:hypothetical protein
VKSLVLFVFTAVAMTPVFGQEVRSSNWGESPDVVLRQQSEENLIAQAKNERVSVLNGTATLDDQPYRIAYEFFDNHLVRVKLSASYCKQWPASECDRAAGWNAFASDSRLTDLLNHKYGRAVEESYTENLAATGFLRRSSWNRASPRKASAEQKWDTEPSVIRLSTTVDDEYGLKFLTLEYRAKTSEEAQFEEFEKAQEQEERNRKDRERLQNAKDL